MRFLPCPRAPPIKEQSDPANSADAAPLSLTTSFTAPAREGVLRTIGKKRGGGRNTFFASAEVFNSEGVLVAFGEGTFRYRTKKTREY